MQTDFTDAQDRHWVDAQTLYAAQRWANADHLYGVAAECALKSLMLVFGMPFDAAKDKPAKNDDRQHIDSIWVRYETYRTGHHQGAAYTLPTGTPFHDWHISQRYADQSGFNSVRVNAHREAAEAARQLVEKARRDGLI